MSFCVDVLDTDWLPKRLVCSIVIVQAHSVRWPISYIPWYHNAKQKSLLRPCSTHTHTHTHGRCLSTYDCIHNSVWNEPCTARYLLLSREFVVETVLSVDGLLLSSLQLRSQRCHFALRDIDPHTTPRAAAASITRLRVYIGRSDIAESVVTIRSPFCGYNTI